MHCDLEFHLRLASLSRISRLRILYKKRILILWPVHQHTDQNCHGCEGPKNLHQKWQDRDAAAVPPTHRHIKKNIADANGPKMHDDDKGVLCSQPACLCPNSCENGDARQMRMTDKDTKHAQKRMLTNIGASSKGTLLKKYAFNRVRTTHCVSSSHSTACATFRCGRRLRLCVSRPCLFVKASTTIRS